MNFDPARLQQAAARQRFDRDPPLAIESENAQQA
jgi:hypothetical protein